MGVEIRLLGPLEVLVGGTPIRLTGRQRTLLPALAVSSGRAVSLDRLTDVIWGADLPANPRASLHTYLTRLRQVLGPGVVEAGPGGYLLRDTAVDVDALRFVQLLDLAATATDTAEERQRLDEALALWRGTPFTGVESRWLETIEAPRLVERYLAAVERRIDLDLTAGRLDGLAAELVELTSRYPLRESLVARLLTVLDRGGRRAEALERYEEFRVQIANDLGADPGPQLRTIHAQLLSAQTSRPPAAPVETVAVPRQLPMDIAGFVGRSSALDALNALLDKTLSPVVITAIGGAAGVGKTALAVHWAHRVACRFPDVQLYVNLRGFDPSGTVMTPAEAIRRFLDALNVAPQRIPADPGAQADLYRTVLADKRMLIVLDNARDPDQVRPLLPGSAGCLVLVTSRHRLTGLIAADGARPLPLDLLNPDEARDLLSRRLGPARVNAESEAVDELIACCARLPLALAIVAANAATQPHLPLAVLAGQLRDRRDRLDALSTGDTAATDVRAVFSWSYDALGEDSARLFRLLGLHPGPDISLAAAASLAGLSAGRVRPLLMELVGAHLISEHVPGRYTFHDLLRAYATDLAHTNDSDAERDAASRRMFDHYLHTAHAANALMDPTRDRLTLAPAQSGTTPEHLADNDEAMDWFSAERAVLLAAIDHTAATGYDTHTWQLTWTFTTFQDRQGHWHDLAATQHASLAAAARLNDTATQANTHRNLGSAYGRLGRFDDAHTHLRQALELDQQAGDLVGQGHTYRSLAVISGRQRQHREALEHARQALDLYQAAGYRKGQARAFNAIGWYYTLLGDHEQALTYCQQALTLLQEFGDRHGQAGTWDSLGHAYHYLGQHIQALTCYHHALDLYRNLGDRHQEAETLTNLGETRAAMGDVASARKAWQEALDIYTELGHATANLVRAKLQTVIKE